MQVADGRDTPSQGRESPPPAPHQGGPLGSSGAASPAPAAPGDGTGKTAPPETDVTPADSKAAQVGSGAATADAKARPTDPDTASSPSKAGSADPDAASVASKAVPADSSKAVPADAEATRSAPAAQADGGGAGEPAAAPAAGKIAAGASPVQGATTGSGVVRTLRQVRPLQAARVARRTTVDWARRPNGRLILPALLATLLIAAAGTAGAYLVPAALRSMPAPTATPSFAPGAQALPTTAGGPPAFPTDTFSPVGPTLSAAPGQVAPGGRPADALAGWAQQVGTRVGIPVVAVQAYGYAELVLNRTRPACRLSWTTLAAIAKVESAHGSANGAVLGADGQALPAIVGLPLDGKGGRQLIADTDGGALDSDRTFDRAMGPLQFIPTTWRENAVDADNNGVTDPNDIDDASLAAGMYLCRDGRDMTKPEDWWEAILSYNDVRPYAQKVFAEANAYGQRSRT